MKTVKKLLLIFIVFCMAVLGGCSSGGGSNTESSKMAVENNAAMDSSQSGNGEDAALTSEAKDNAAEQPSLPAQSPESSQMVIYQADLQLRVKKFEETMVNIEEKVKKYGGYISESNVTKGSEDQLSGSITLRVPQEKFQDFLHDVEGEAAEVLQRNITGQDVTEEYVDLESRLKSKRAVEERLLSFMKGAAKTEDLLKISADLAAVQEEIETIQGRMKYLENRTSLATITIALFEDKVVVPPINKDDLNTWEKTKEQFMKSINLLLSGLSGLVVFLIGNLPIIGLAAVLGILLFLYYKKWKKRNDRDV